MGILQNVLKATGKEICEKEKHFGECQVLEALPTQSTETILKLTVNVSVQTIKQRSRKYCQQRAEPHCNEPYFKQY